MIISSLLTQYMHNLNLQHYGMCFDLYFLESSLIQSSFNLILSSFDAFKNHPMFLHRVPFTFQTHNITLKWYLDKDIHLVYGI